MQKAQVTGYNAHLHHHIASMLHHQAIYGYSRGYSNSVGQVVITCDLVMDMDDNPQMPIILGRPLLATTGVMIDVQVGTLSFQLYRGG